MGPAGRSYNNVSISCEDCPQGQSHSGRNPLLPCFSCSPGYFVRNSTALNCDACQEGRFQGELEAIVYRCKTCSFGKYALNSTSQSCSKCEEGRYKHLEIASTNQCFFCPRGFGYDTAGTACTA